jgi:hypothetical protein
VGAYAGAGVVGVRDQPDPSLPLFDRVRLAYLWRR